MKVTYIGTNFSSKFFFEYSRWFPVNLKFSLPEVVIDLYWVIVLGCLSRNTTTSLYSILPVEETRWIYMKYIVFNTINSNICDYWYCNTIRIMQVPVCTLSPTCSSDIVTTFPLSRFTVAVDGKQPPDFLGGGGGEGSKTFIIKKNLQIKFFRRFVFLWPSISFGDQSWHADDAFRHFQIPYYQ